MSEDERSATPPTEASDEVDNEVHIVEESDEDANLAGLVSSFCDITGSDPESGRNFLEAMGWDLETAISLSLGAEPVAAPAFTPSPPGNARTASIGTSQYSAFAGVRHEAADAERTSARSSSGVPAIPPAAFMGEMFDSIDGGGGVERGVEAVLRNAIASGGYGYPGYDYDGEEEEEDYLHGDDGAADIGAGFDADVAAGGSAAPADGATVEASDGAAVEAGATTTAADSGAGAIDAAATAMHARHRASRQRAAERVRARIAAGGISHMDMPFPHHMREEEEEQRRDEFDEDGIRRPDPVRQGRLVSSSRIMREEAEDVLARADDPSIEWLFDPPRHLSFVGSLDQARATASAESRWILVNIQSHNEFTSHMLNRDTFTDETIESFLRTTFLLWQRGHTSRDGETYMRMYKLSEEDLPHMALLDPRTGAKIKSWMGFLSADELASKLVEFTDDHSLDSATLPSLPSRARLSSSSRASSASPSIIAAGASSTAASASTSASLSDLASMGGTTPPDERAVGVGGSDSSRSSSSNSSSSSSSSSSDGKPAASGARAGADYCGGEGTGTVFAGGGLGPTARGGGTGVEGIAYKSGEAGEGDSGDKQVEGVTKRISLEEFGAVPDEPGTAGSSAEDVTKVSIRLSTGKSCVRRYRKSDTVRALFAVALREDADACSRAEAGKLRGFDLQTVFPVRASLLESLDATLVEKDLCNSRVQVTIE